MTAPKSDLREILTSHKLSWKNRTMLYSLRQNLALIRSLANRKRGIGHMICPPTPDPEIHTVYISGLPTCLRQRLWSCWLCIHVFHCLESQAGENGRLQTSLSCLSIALPNTIFPSFSCTSSFSVAVQWWHTQQQYSHHQCPVNNGQDRWYTSTLLQCSDWPTPSTVHFPRFLAFTNTTLPPKFDDRLAFWQMVWTERTYKSKILQAKT